MQVQPARATDTQRQLLDAASMGVSESASALIEALHRLETERDGFAGADVATVEAAWSASNVDFWWDGGFVVGLHDGRRAYIAASRCPIYAEDNDETYVVDWQCDVRFLADEPYHNLTPLLPTPEAPWEWEEAPRELNDLLQSLQGFS